MSKSTAQKAKLLILYDILCRLTDEYHALNTDEIISLLAEKNITVARKVLVQDINLLNENGYEVLSYKKKFHYYYVVNRHFDTAEIAMLADAVQASKLSARQKQSLTYKLMTTIGDYQAARLLDAECLYSMPKRNNANVINIIDTLKQAIADGKQASFRYYSLDYKKNKVYHKNGDRYIVNPLAVVWNKDNYYLICYDGKHDGTANYRIDRMEDATEEATARVERNELAEFDIERYRQKVFSMYGGVERQVELEFVSEMLDDIFDKFGEEIDIEKKGNCYTVAVPVQISKTFFSWVVGTQGKVRIKSPNEVCEQFNCFVEKIKEEY